MDSGDPLLMQYHVNLLSALVLGIVLREPITLNREPAETFTTLDLFAGAGGLSLGFHGAGARPLGAVEIDAAAAETFSRVFSDSGPVVHAGPDQGDVNTLDAATLLGSLGQRPDVVIGGPPCQGFSRIGRAKHASLLGREERIRNGGVRDTGRNHLYQYFLDVVRLGQPQGFVMENVPGMREMMGNDFAQRISREAYALGYNVRYFMLNAASYGVPQNRWRVFFVGIRGDLGLDAIPKPPPRTHTAMEDMGLTSLADDDWFIPGSQVPLIESPLPVVTVADAIADLPKLKGHLRGGKAPTERLPLRRPPTEYAKRLRDWPGLPAPAEVSGNWYRVLGGFTGRKDHLIFEQMAQGDKYPDAIALANQLFQETLDSMDDPPLPGTKAWEDLKAKHVPGYRNDAFDDKWRKLIASEPSWTVTAHLSRDSYSHIHYDSRQARTITVREAARLQSFPDAVDFCGNNGDQLRQIGNAVPPLLARAIADQLMSQLRTLRAERARRAAASSVVG